MGGNHEDESDNLSSKHEQLFTYKTLKEKCWNYIKIYPKRIPKLITTLFMLWALIKIILYEKPNTLQEFILPVIVISFIISLYENYTIYLKDIPECIKSENKLLRDIVFKQKAGWNYDLSYRMLTDKVLKHELTLERVKLGAEFIEPMTVDEFEYVNLIRKQPVIIKKLLQAAKVTCVEILPKVISSASTGKDSDLKVLQKEIENLDNIYFQMVSFEKRIMQTIPPDGFEELNNLMSSWTDSIRNGINDFIEFQKKLSEVNKKNLKEKSKELQNLTITFEPHMNIEKFNNALEAITEKMNSMG